MDMEANTLLELTRILDQAKEHDIRILPLLMHSFSFCRPNTSCPINENIQRFDKLLKYIAKDEQMDIITMAEFAELYEKNPEQFIGSGFIPETGYLMTLYRSFIRLNQGWKNIVFFSANLAALIAIVIVTIIIIKRILRRRNTT